MALKALTAGLAVLSTNKQKIALTAALTVVLCLQGQSFALHPQALQAYQKGLAASNAQQWKLAEGWFRQSATLDPTDPLTQLQLGQVLAQQGLTQAAIAAYQQAASLNATDPMLYYSMAALYEQEQQWPQAKQAYETALRQNPDYQYGLFSLGRVLAQLGERQQAMQAYRAFLANYPTHTEAQKQLAQLYMVEKQPAEAIKVLQILQSQQGNGFEEGLLMAKALLQNKQPNEALAWLQQQERKGENASEVQERTGQAYEQLNEPRNAIVAYKKALALDAPTYLPLRLKVAQLLLEQKEPAAAEEQLTAYLKAKPGNAQAQWLLAKATLDTEQYEQAIPLLETLMKAPEVKPEAKAAVALQLGFALQRVGKAQQALAVYEPLHSKGRQLLSEADKATLTRNLALAYHQHGDWEKALPFYREALAGKPSTEANKQTPSSTTDPFTGAIVNATSNAEEQQATQALREDALGLLKAMAEKATTEKDYAKAEAAYRETLLLQPKHPDALLGLGQLATAQQRYEEAKRYFEQVLAEEPGNPMAQLVMLRLAVAEGSQTQAQGLEALNTASASIIPTWPKPAQTEARDSQAEWALAEQQWPVVLSSLAALEALRPLSTEEQFSRGVALYNLKQYASASAAYQSSLKLSPANATIAYNVGLSELAQKRYPQAESAFINALVLEPTLSEAHYGLFLSAEPQKQWGKAAAHLEKALQLDATNELGDATQKEALQKRVLVLKQQAKAAKQTVALTVIPVTKPTAAANPNVPSTTPISAGGTAFSPLKPGGTTGVSPQASAPQAVTKATANGSMAKTAAKNINTAPPANKTLAGNGKSQAGKSVQQGSKPTVLLAVPLPGL